MTIRVFSRTQLSYPLIVITHHCNNKVRFAVLMCLVAQSCLTLSELMDCSPPGFSVHGLLQARILECHSSGRRFSSSEDLPNPGIKPRSPALQVLYCVSYREILINCSKSQSSLFHFNDNIQIV